MLTSDRSLDVAKALQLRVKGLAYSEIGKLLCPEQPFSKQAVHDRLSRFERFLTDPEGVRAAIEARTGLLNAAEFELLHSCLDPEKLAKASLNNVAYALTQVSTLRRLEEGKSTENIGVLSKIVVQNDDGLFPKSRSYEKPVEQGETCTILKTEGVNSTEIVSEQVDK